MKAKIISIGIIGLLPFLIHFKIEQQAEGEKIFKQNCSTCHTIGNGKLTGPDLKGVTSRRKEEWLMQFIKSPKALIKSGDKTAMKIYNAYNKVVMPDQNLTDQELRGVLGYIRLKSEVKVSVPDTNSIKPILDK